MRIANWILRKDESLSITERRENPPLRQECLATPRLHAPSGTALKRDGLRVGGGFEAEGMACRIRTNDILRSVLKRAPNTSTALPF